MNEDTLVAICAYTGDQHQVINALGQYIHHQCPVVVFSPTNAPAHVVYPGIERRFIGEACYIGGSSLDRQRQHLETLLTYPHKFFLLHDSDSFCLSPKLPDVLYKCSQKTIWSNEVTEPRPHQSPYPKLAFQPPYFLSRNVIEQMLRVAGRVGTHPITPYIDWWMLAVSHEAGLHHRSFTALEHTARTEEPFTGSDPWETLEYRIRYMGSKFMHPIKTISQLQLCINAHGFYESQS